MDIKDFGTQTKYLKWYFDIIALHSHSIRHKNTEAHHIFPKFAFGQNTATVFVSYRVHFILHMLLAKHYKHVQSPLYAKAVYPLVRMKSPIKNQYVLKDHVLTSRTFETIKQMSIDAMTGANNPFYGKKHSNETRQLLKMQRIGKMHSEESKLLISTSSKARWDNQEYRQKVLSSMKGRVVSQETRNKISALHTGKKRSDETKHKISQSKIGIELAPFSQQHCDRISSALKGRVFSEEHRNKINKNPEKIRKTAEKHRGMKRTDETRKKISDSKKGKLAYNTGLKTFFNPDTNEIKQFAATEEIPSGWIKGDPRLKRKNKNA